MQKNPAHDLSVIGQRNPYGNDRSGIDIAVAAHSGNRVSGQNLRLHRRLVLFQKRLVGVQIRIARHSDGIIYVIFIYNADIIFFIGGQLGDIRKELLSRAAAEDRVAAAYLLGSLNFAIIVSKKLYGKDIRKYGSHNAGVTNMFRTFGKKAGFLTLAGDAGKALVSVLLGRLLLGEDGAYLAGLFCILGHIAPAYYRFKGGKGVVVTAVTVAIIDPVIFAVLVVVFALVFLIWRYVSLASVIAAFVYPGAVFISAQIRSGGQGMPYMTAMLFSAFVALLILFLHRENIKRIFERTESKVYFRKKKPLPDNGEQTDEQPARPHVKGRGKKKK